MVLVGDHPSSFTGLAVYLRGVLARVDFKWRASRAPDLAIAVSLAALILPSHLVWKPYFVMALPLAMIAAARARTFERAAFLVVLFALINLTGFDFVGSAWGARFEAASLFLWAELALIGFVLKTEA